MDILISMKAETIQKGLYMNCNIMQMPTAQTKPYFILELREDNEDRLKLIKKYAEILSRKFDGDEEFLIEHTKIGIILKKKVDENIEYIWVDPSKLLSLENLDMYLRDLLKGGILENL